MPAKILATATAVLLVLAFASVVSWSYQAAIILLTLATIGVIVVLAMRIFKGDVDKPSKYLRWNLAVEIFFISLGYLLIVVFDNWFGMMPYFYSLFKLRSEQHGIAVRK